MHRTFNVSSFYRMNQIFCINLWPQRSISSVIKNKQRKWTKPSWEDALRMKKYVFSLQKYLNPDIFQEKMIELFNGLEYVRAYIDDLLIISNGNFEDNQTKLKSF